MNSKQLQRALDGATRAALTAGALMREKLLLPKKISHEQQHDIKLELDLRCQRMIEKSLRKTLSSAALLGEEGITGDPNAEARWVIDPIDGTVNFTYGIPHACVSIALQRRAQSPRSRSAAGDEYETLVGVVYEPFCRELWTATARQPARLNGRAIRVSERRRLNQSIVSLGFAKYTDTLRQMLPVFNRLIHRVRKVRIMGAAALSFVYVATGRFDAYVESGVRLWDIAAGGLIVERAGGEFWRRPVEGREHTYEIIATNSHLLRKLQRYARAARSA